MIVAKQSGYQDFIIRPLSARLLPETLPEREGKVDRGRLLDISGRSRKPQIELAAHYGITEYPQPAGGCLLTEPGYSRRLRELMEHSPVLDIRDIQLLRIGRHFRLGTGEKVIVGRDKDENEKLLSLKDEEGITLRVRDYPSPITIIPHGASQQDAIAKAASICVRYSDAPQGEGVIVTHFHQGKRYALMAKTLPQEEIERIRI